MGVLLGEAGLGIDFENASAAHALGFYALVLILAEGGPTTQWQEIRPSMGWASPWPPSVSRSASR